MEDAAPFVMESAPGAETVINGRRCLYFGGTGYFGLHGHPDVLAAGTAAFGRGTHSATTRAGFGNTPVLLDLEEKLAAFFGAEAAVYYPSGYLNTLLLAQALDGEFEAAFIDGHAHFSIRDGIRTTGKPLFEYRHGDAGDLRTRLKSGLKAGERPLVLSDGVFPAFGDLAPVPALIEALAPYDGRLALDDAHGVGVLGPNGRGTYEHFGVSGPRLHFTGTMSKAFGGYGGFLAAPAGLAAKVRRDVGAYSGSSPAPTPIAAASACGLDLVRAHPEWRSRLRENAARLKSGLRSLGIDPGNSPAPIAAWSLGSAAEMKGLQAALMERGVALAFLHYAGAPSGGVLRATVFSTHTPAHIDRLLDEIKRRV